MSANTNKIREGKSNGWSLIYCKGPEGEQLEFVQALGPVKQTFADALERRRQVIASRSLRSDGQEATRATIPVCSGERAGPERQRERGRIVRARRLLEIETGVAPDRASGHQFYFV